MPLSSQPESLHEWLARSCGEAKHPSTVLWGAVFNPPSQREYQILIRNRLLSQSRPIPSSRDYAMSTPLGPPPLHGHSESQPAARRGDMSEGIALS